MRTHFPRRLRLRRWLVIGLAGVWLTLLSAQQLATAVPTDPPSAPNASVGPTTASPSAVPTSSANPSPSTTPTPTAAAPLTSPTPSAAAPLREPAAAPTASAAPAARVQADERYDDSVGSSCAASGQLGALRVQLHLNQQQPFGLDYLVRGAGGFERRGTVQVDDEMVILDVSGLTTGDYTFNLFEVGGTEPIEVNPFSVVGCVTTRANCNGITFTNPVSNPAVRVETADPDVDDLDLAFVLAPGASRTIGVAYPVLEWSAFTHVDGPGGSGARIGAGRGTVQNPSDCSEPFDLSQEVSCGSEATVHLQLYLLVATTAVFEVRHEGEVVVRRAFGPEDEGVDFTDPLDGLGDYTFTLWLDGANRPIATGDFQVLRCLSVKPGCRAVTFTNPEANPAIYILYAAPGSENAAAPPVELAPGASASVPWRKPVLIYVTGRIGGGDAVEEVGRSDNVRVDQACTTGVSAGEGDTGANPGGGSASLAATGGPAGAMGWVIAGLLAAASGLLLVRCGQKHHA